MFAIQNKQILLHQMSAKLNTSIRLPPPKMAFFKGAEGGVVVEKQMNKGGKVLKKLWCCVSGRV